MKSEDGGRTWKNLFNPTHSGTLPHRLTFCSEDDGLLMSHSDSDIVYFKTHNGGRDWLQAHRLPNAVFGEVSSLPRSRKYCGLIKPTGQHAFLEIIDADLTVRKRIPTTISGEIRDMVFADELNGWILEQWNENSWITGSPKTHRTTILIDRSEDGGNSWQVISRNEISAQKLWPVSANQLLMAGADGIFRSDDSGTTWSKVHADSNIPLFDIHFAGPVGAAIGTEDLIESERDLILVLSNDSGGSWVKASMPSVEPFMGIRMMTWETGVLASCNSIYTFQIG
jgi:photosystem II stability/assembly factor-like uncharacterized protein